MAVFFHHCAQTAGQISHHLGQANPLDDGCHHRIRIRLAHGQIVFQRIVEHKRCLVQIGNLRD